MIPRMAMPLGPVDAEKLKRPSKTALLLGILGQGVLAAYFVFAGLSKFTSGPGRTIAALDAMSLIDTRYAIGIAKALAPLEVMLGAWLASGLFPRLSLLVCSITLVGFPPHWSHLVKQSVGASSAVAWGRLPGPPYRKASCETDASLSSRSLCLSYTGVNRLDPRM